MPPPQGQSGYSGFSGASGYSGRSGPMGLQGPTGPQGVAGPIGSTGAIGASGYSGYSGAGLSGVSVVNGNLTAQGSITAAAKGNGTISLSGSVSGMVQLTVSDEAGTGKFKLPSTSGDQTLATQSDLAALRAELLRLIS